MNTIADHRNAILHEQLALHRLKRLEAKEEERRERAAVILLRPLWKALKWLLTPTVPLRRDAPHLPPVPQCDWDKGERYLQRFF